MPNVIAIKGLATSKAIIGTPTPVDVTFAGKKMRGGYKVWSIGTGIVKRELYGWLRLKPPLNDGDEYQSGFCHFPEYGESFFKEMTSEHLISVTNRKGYSIKEWVKKPGRENHFLDCRVYARAAASLCGLDRLVSKKKTRDAPRASAPQPKQSMPRQERKGGWISRKRLF